MGNECCDTLTLFSGEDGNGIVSILWTSNSGGSPQGTANTTDTYTITYTNATTQTFVLGNGINGVYGGYSSEWLFDNGTTPTPITTAGDFRFNNATLSAVTGIIINETNADATDLNAFLAGFTNSGNFGLLRISKKSDSSIFWMGIITANSDLGDQYDVTLTHVASNGPFTNSDPCVVSFVNNGAPGIDGTNGTNGTNATDLYDSGWIDMNDYTIAKGYGFPSFTNWLHPKIRVIGRHVYIEGRVLIPMATSAAPTVLLVDESIYPTVQKANTQVFTGTEGGFFVNFNVGSLVSNAPIMPTDLRPTVNHRVNDMQTVLRVVEGTLSQAAPVGSVVEDLVLTTILPIIQLYTSGEIVMSSFKDVLDSASGGPASYNSPLHTIIMNVDAGEEVINHQNYKQQYTTGSTTFEIIDLGFGYTDGTHTGVTTTSDISGGVGKIFTVVIDASKIISVTQTTAGTGYITGETVSLDDGSGNTSIGTGTTKASIKINITAYTDDRVISVSHTTYPATFDGLNVSTFGGIIIPFTCNYPLGQTITETQIIAAITNIQS